MKKAILLLLSLSISNLAFTQDSNQFGFVAKVGSHAIPNKSIVPNYYYNVGSDTRTTEHNLGSTYSLGVWHSISLGKYVRLTSELLYRHTNYTTKETTLTNIITPPSTSSFEQKQFVQLSSFSLPVKFEFAFVKNSKLSFSLGSGISMPFSAGVRTKQVSQNPGLPPFFEEYSTQYTDLSYFSPKINFNSGVNYQIDAQTSIGLEYVFEKPSLDTQAFEKRFFNGNIIDCICFYMPPTASVQSNSFSLTLRHNILKKDPVPMQQ